MKNKSIRLLAFAGLVVFVGACGTATSGESAAEQAQPLEQDSRDFNTHGFYKVPCEEAIVLNENEVRLDCAQPAVNFSGCFVFLKTALKGFAEKEISYELLLDIPDASEEVYASCARS